VSGTQPGGGDTSKEESTTRREEDGRRRQAEGAAHFRAARASESPESAAMGAARGGIEADARMARTLTSQENAAQAAAREENIREMSRDAKVAMRLIVQDVETLGVDRKAALRAQVGIRDDDQGVRMVRWGQKAVLK
jgi:hypothetical protein